MRVTVIIVNYNVRHFLEQCLCSVRKAAHLVDTEVIVVDNASSDGSRAWLEPRFPEVRFIWNAQNLGFAKANNQALALATGEHVLFLNPDTILPEDALARCVAFMDAHPDAGALGTRMLDGSGSFLPESKRAFPSPLTSFFKLSGLSAIFPRSALFARYHLGHLDPMKDHSVEVLAGAFMFVRKKVLDITGGFDEVFFMYGEDIDLSYRILQAGYRNYYLTEPAIIHFKGESTRKGSMNYVRMFYNAMYLFVHKHYGGVRAGFFRFFISLAIWFRAGLSALGRFIRRIGMPVVDAALILLAFWLAKYTWQHFAKPDTVYSQRLLTIAFPCFTAIHLTASYYAGLYDRYEKKGRLLRATAIALVSVLTVYSLLPETLRFSRAIMVLGTTYAFLLLSANRLLLRRWGLLSREDKEERQTLVAGSETEFARVLRLMRLVGMEDRILGRAATGADRQEALTTVPELKEFIRSLPVREVIFCENGLSFSEIIRQASDLGGTVRIRITASGSDSIVGSDSKDAAGDTLSHDLDFRIGFPGNRRAKRAVDLLCAALAWVLFPLHFVMNRHPVGLLVHAVQVLAGKKTWIGYSTNGTGLPMLRRGVLGTHGQPVGETTGAGEEGLRKLDEIYARDHSAFGDLERIRKGYRKLGAG
jgi:GT2 family glycosyltransferase